MDGGHRDLLGVIGDVQTPLRYKSRTFLPVIKTSKWKLDRGGEGGLPDTVASVSLRIMEKCFYASWIN